MHVLFKTIHGSRLYNLSNPDSDYDYYTVIDRVKSNKARYAKQSIVGDQDSMVVELSTWLDMCRNGVPQACEAMFSTMPIVDEINDFRSHFRISTGAVERYIHTITSFCYTQDNKRKRHGLRLALNCHDFTRFGRFNPTLSENDVDFVTGYAKKDCDLVYGMAMMIALDQLPARLVR